MESHRQRILELIAKKSNLKQKIFDTTFSSFNLLKDTLFEMASEIDDQLEGQLDRRVRLEYRDRGKFEAQLQVADDTLIFQMHTDVFKFDEHHPVWSNEYVAEDKNRAYCGVINIYNFLSGSFKFNRNADEGYLIGRIFVNGDRYYFAEGKGQASLRNEEFGSTQLDRVALVEILESAVLYSLNFDLLIPPFEFNHRVKIDQFNTKMDNSKFETGKRLGYDYNTKNI